MKLKSDELTTYVNVGNPEIIAILVMVEVDLRIVSALLEVLIGLLAVNRLLCKDC